VRFFTVLEPNKPVCLKSSFGPISVRETIYPSTIQDALFVSRSENQRKLNQHNQHLTDDNLSVLPANTAEITAHLVTSTIYRNNPELRILFHSNTASSQTTTLNDINQDLHQDKLEIAVQSNATKSSEHHLCAISIVKFNSIEQDKNENLKPLIASCKLNKDGVCLTKITIPANWWPAVILDSVASNNEQLGSKQTFSQTNKQTTKPNSAEVLYTTVYSEKCGEQNDEQEIHQHKHKDEKKQINLKNEYDAMANLNWQNNVLHTENIGKILLKPFDGVYETLTNDDIIRILIPQKPVHSNNRINIPICYRYHRNYPLFAFALRIRVRPGMRILDAKLSKKVPINLQTITNLNKSSKRKQNRLLNEYNKLNSAQNWEISIESNSKKTQATITAFLKLNNNKDELPIDDKKTKQDDEQDDNDDLDDDLEEFDEDLMNLMPSTCNEVYAITLEVTEKAIDFSDAGRIVWQLLYLTDLENTNQDETRKHHLKRDFDRESSKLISKLDIQKDEIQSLIAITRNRNLLNTAILTGKQNQQPLKIYFVSNTGKFGDVTLQSSCSSLDETVLKVSPSCTAIYLDGSETKSSINATISIQYGSLSRLASYQVWMPKLPLELDVSDDVLSAIHSWKIPHLKQLKNSSNHHRMHKMKSQHSKHLNKHHSHHQKHENNNLQTAGEIGCRTRYQQAYIKAYAKFYISDENSAREWSYINRKYSFLVTDLILPHLHLSDNRLAILRSNTIEGLNPGSVDLNIISPITGKQLATKKNTNYLRSRNNYRFTCSFINWPTNADKTRTHNSRSTSI